MVKMGSKKFGRDVRTCEHEYISLSSCWCHGRMKGSVCSAPVSHISRLSAFVLLSNFPGQLRVALINYCAFLRRCFYLKETRGMSSNWQKLKPNDTTLIFVGHPIVTRKRVAIYHRLLFLLYMCILISQEIALINEREQTNPMHSFNKYADFLEQFTWLLQPP